MPMLFAQIEGCCYACGNKGHLSNKHGCPESKKPKQEWWINKAQQHLQVQPEPSSSTGSTASNPPSISKVATVASRSSHASFNNNNNDNNDRPQAWVNVHVMVQLYQLLENYNSSDMRNWILLDNESSMSIFCNPRYVDNIISIPESHPSMQVITNRGSFDVQKRAQVPYFGTVWYYKSSITNIFSLEKWQIAIASLMIIMMKSKVMHS